VQIRKLDYFQHIGTPKEWEFNNFTFRKVNLFVGRNSIGKTRTLNVIGSLAKVLSNPNAGIGNGGWDAEFLDKKGSKYNFRLLLKQGKVTSERLDIDGKRFLTRKSKRLGEIYYTEVENHLNFKIGEKDVAVLKLRDAIQHPFLEPLINWSKNVSHFRFGTNLGKRTLHSGNDEFSSPDDLNPMDFFLTTEYYQVGKKKHGEKFKKSILRDIKSLGFAIDDIGTSQIEGLKINPTALGPGISPSSINPVGIYIREIGNKYKVTQDEISEGLFRAISLVVQLNSLIYEKKANCFIIDDIGEGLDFQRSKLLIKLITEKSVKNNIQLIMATNDRFIMNSVPLKYWSIIEREKSKLFQFNYENSKKEFDDFETSGLMNFDLFQSKLYRNDRQ
jgi:hypothetical protein